jgi:hypothetical protein
MHTRNGGININSRPRRKHRPPQLTKKSNFTLLIYQEQHNDSLSEELNRTLCAKLDGDQIRQVHAGLRSQVDSAENVVADLAAELAEKRAQLQSLESCSDLEMVFGGNSSSSSRRRSSVNNASSSEEVAEVRRLDDSSQRENKPLMLETTSALDSGGFSKQQKKKDRAMRPGTTGSGRSSNNNPAAPRGSPIRLSTLTVKEHYY